jgi:hypothetical protein
MKQPINLINLPKLKALLTSYISMLYEEDAIVTDEYLLMEFNLLKRENRLHELFEQEFYDNTGEFPDEFLWV